jgi:tetratricopeptide (TPR) repeat protein
MFRYVNSLLLAISITIAARSGLSGAEAALANPSTPGDGWKHTQWTVTSLPHVPVAAQQAFARANALHVRGELRAADQVYTEAINVWPNFAEAYDNRGMVRRHLGELDQSVADHTAALAIHPRLFSAYNNRGLALHALNRHAEALRDLTLAIQADAPDTVAVACNSRGVVQTRLMNFAEAIADFSRAIQLQPGYWEAYGNRALAYGAGLGQHRQAVADFTQALALNPGFAEAYSNRAVAWFHLGDYGQARADVARYQQFGGRPAPDFLAALTAAAPAEPERTQDPAPSAEIKAGDTVVVRDNVALCKGHTTIAELPKGTALYVREVRDEFVGGSATVNGQEYLGWLEKEHVTMKVPTHLASAELRGNAGAPRTLAQEQPVGVVQAYLAAAASLDASVSKAFLSRRCRDDLVVECQANAPSGWKFSAEDTRVVGEAIDHGGANATVRMQVVFKGGTPPTFMGKAQKFTLVLENGAWKIDGLDPAPRRTGPGVMPLGR